MDILRNLVGNLAAGIIRLLVTVGIIFAAYFFLLKPVLKSADNAVKTSSTAFEHSGLNSLTHSLGDAGEELRREVRRSFHSASRHGNPKKLVRCVERAQGSAPKIRRCAVKF